MKRIRSTISVVLALGIFAAAPASSFDLAGNGSRWHAAVSQTPVGHGNGRTFSQWSISIYHGNTLAYQSPRDGGPLTKVVKAHGADMWFPDQSASIVGAASLLGGTAKQLVVESHETGADCGGATVTVFRYDNTGKKVVPAVTVQNSCELTASVSGNAIHLSGPYYGPKAALCCPTKTKATATLVYHSGKWMETPHYYQLFPNSFRKF